MGILRNFFQEKMTLRNPLGDSWIEVLQTGGEWVVKILFTVEQI